MSKLRKREDPQEVQISGVAGSQLLQLETEKIQQAELSPLIEKGAEQLVQVKTVSEMQLLQCCTGAAQQIVESAFR
jgi:hypothetical protein